MNQKTVKILRWTTRILALLVLLFALPFYFGYGNPLPFINPAYTLWDNVWLTVFPLVFIGLALGWKFEKTGGYFIVLPILSAIFISLVFVKDFGFGVMFVPLVLGLMYLIVGYNKIKIK